MKILITGANGFVGRSLTRVLLDAGHQVVGLTSRPFDGDPALVQRYSPARDFIDIDQCWPHDDAVDCVVHLAARVHQREEARQSFDTRLAAYRETNVEGSLRVARAAWKNGVRRLIFVSSVKAMGESEPGYPSHAWSERDTPMPVDPYGISKEEAERALLSLGQNTRMEVVVVRPPLVYGPGVRANFLQLLRAATSGLPLPFGAITARRSMIYIGNLSDAIARCCTHPAAAGQVFNVSDGVDVTVPELITDIARLHGVRVRLWRLPVSWLERICRLAGRADQVQRLVSPLRVDTTHIRLTLAWVPPYTVTDGIRATLAAVTAGTRH
ncbi:NAD-dependent epimerase/dehydratase family protein [Robbsia andropogonis]|uniref:NAD-dependent epimerase/dehydratase family protein n=1 Tax=Robbsia andropogonis TaxID=28092 RepID=UPI002A698F41|nr:NAD-dependent epimerase/dehydratase family protein [Robbsia andropogonis]